MSRQCSRCRDSLPSEETHATCATCRSRAAQQISQKRAALKEAAALLPDNEQQSRRRPTTATMAPANMPFSSINIEAAVIDDGAEGYADDKLPAAGEADGVVDGSDGEEESCGVEVSDGEGESEPRDYGALLLAREAEEEGNRTRLALEEQTSLIDLFTRYAELLGTQDAPDRDAMSKLYRLAQPLRTQLELMEKAVVDEHEGRSIAQRVLRKMAKVKGFNALAALTKGYGEKWLGLK